MYVCTRLTTRNGTIDPCPVTWLHFSYQGRNEGGQEGKNSSSVESLWGRRKVPTMSQAVSSIQYIYFRKTSGSNMGAPILLLGRAPSNLVAPPAPYAGVTSFSTSLHTFSRNHAPFSFLHNERGVSLYLSCCTEYVGTRSQKQARLCLLRH